MITETRDQRRLEAGWQAAPAVVNCAAARRTDLTHGYPWAISIPIRSPPAPKSRARSASSPRPTGSRPRSAWRILEKGGNAFDAGVATAFTLQVVEPHLNGPGGDVPIIVHDVKRGRTEVICGQGPAPAGATIAHYKSEGLEMVPGTGLLAACVPGTFESWMLLLRDYGTHAAARRAGTGDRLCPRRLSAGRARGRHHQNRRAIVPETLADLGRGLSAEQRGAETRHDLHQRKTRRNLYAHPERGRKRRRRSRRANRSARAKPGRKVLSPKRSASSAARRK